MANRRGFLKALAGIVPAAVAATVPGVGKESAPLADGFKFPCDNCSASVVAKIPAKVGGRLKVKCECGRQWWLTWRGTSFSVKDA